MHRICHAKVHSVLSEQELQDWYHTPERLRTHPELVKFIRWVARKDPQFIDGHHGPRRR